MHPSRPIGPSLRGADWSVIVLLLIATPTLLALTLASEIALGSAGHQVSGYSFVLEVPQLGILSITLGLFLECMFPRVEVLAGAGITTACAAVIVGIWILCMDDHVRSSDVARVAATAGIVVVGSAAATGLYRLTRRWLSPDRRHMLTLLVTLGAIVVSIIFVIIVPYSPAKGVHVSVAEIALMRMNLAFPVAWAFGILVAMLLPRFRTLERR